MSNHQYVKPLSQLTLLDRFLFDSAVTDPEICRLILELCLSKEISGIKINDSERVIECYNDSRAIRLDLLAVDDADTFYDAEMQKKRTNNIPMRSRLYQSCMDVSMLQSGTVDLT